MVWPFALSRSTGNLPIGQIFLNAALEAGSPRSTTCGSNGVSFSYRAMSTFWQNDDEGMEVELE